MYIPARDTHFYEDRTCSRFVGTLPLRHSEGIEPYFHIEMDKLYGGIMACVVSVSICEIILKQIAMFTTCG